MARPDDDLQTKRDIRAAHSLVSRLRGISTDDSVAVLHDHAALTGVSVHSAALAVLAEWRPVGEPRRTVPVARARTTATRTGRIVLRWQGRERASLWVSGLCSDDLAARLRRAVERAMRAGATELVIDTRRTTGAATALDDVLIWTGDRLSARHGTLTLRTPEREAPGAP